MNRASVVNLLLAALTGFGLRVYQLSEQALTGDEWHSLRAASDAGSRELLTTVRTGAHYSVPEALFFRLLSSQIAVSELVIYAPYVLTGLLTILLIPTSFASRIRGALTVLPWAIALSPTFIFFSRYARPYGPMTLSAVLAVTIFVRWEESRNPRDLAAYTFFASAAIYLHVVSLPFVFAPLAIYLIRCVGKRDRIREGLRTALMITTPALLLVGLPLARSPRALTEKMGGTTFTISSFLSGLTTTIGGQELWVAIPLLSLGILGAVDTWRRSESRRLLLHFAFASVVQIAAILAAQPVAGQGPHIFARYAIPVSLFALVMASAGLSRAVSFVPSSIQPYKGVVISFVLLVFFLGTTAGTMRRNGAQVNLSILGYLIWGSEWSLTLEEGFASHPQAVYERFSTLEPGSLQLVEIPYKANDYYLPTRQSIHHQRTSYAYTDGTCSDIPPGKGNLDLRSTLSRFRLVHTFSITSARELPDGIDIAVMHRNLADETSYPDEFGTYDLDNCIEMLAREFGPPILDDDGLVLFATSEEGLRASIKLGFTDPRGQ